MKREGEEKGWRKGEKERQGKKEKERPRSRHKQDTRFRSLPPPLTHPPTHPLAKQNARDTTDLINILSECQTWSRSCAEVERNVLERRVSPPALRARRKISVNS